MAFSLCDIDLVTLWECDRGGRDNFRYVWALSPSQIYHRILEEGI